MNNRSKIKPQVLRSLFDNKIVKYYEKYISYFIESIRFWIKRILPVLIISLIAYSLRSDFLCYGNNFDLLSWTDCLKVEFNFCYLSSIQGTVFGSWCWSDIWRFETDREKLFWFFLFFATFKLEKPKNKLLYKIWARISVQIRSKIQRKTSLENWKKIKRHSFRRSEMISKVTFC